MYTDLHCHLLPHMDDGAADLKTSLAMARLAVDDGISRLACTPHIYPGLYHTDAPRIALAKGLLAERLRREGIFLDLSVGADIHFVPGLLQGLKEGRLPTINGSRYLLLEPSHHVPPPCLEQGVFELLTHGYVPMITHPERLSWVHDHYERIVGLGRQGAWLQVTAGSLLGDFGRRARYWAERMVGDGVVHVLATDAHGVDRRPPLMSEAAALVRGLVGAEESEAMTDIRTSAVWEDRAPRELPMPPGYETPRAARKTGLMKRISRTWFRSSRG